jgi:hypothetical protein
MHGAVIRQNKRDKTDLPSISVRTSSKTYACRKVWLEQGCVVQQNYEKPLSSGAVAWIETDAGMVLEM